jgi:hypothetical protein
MRTIEQRREHAKGMWSRMTPEQKAERSAKISAALTGKKRRKKREVRGGGNLGEMTFRDYIAVRVLQMYAVNAAAAGWDMKDCARDAYLWADALIAERGTK